MSLLFTSLHPSKFSYVFTKYGRNFVSCCFLEPYMVGMNPDSKIHVEGVAATVTGLGIRDGLILRSPLQILGCGNAQFAHENDTSNLSCELCGVLRDLSLYFNNISEAEAGGI